MLVIGSTALKHFGIDLPRQKQSDLDLIGTPDEIEGFLPIHGLTSRKIETSRRGYVIHRRDGKLPIEIEVAKDGNSADQLLDIIATTNGLATPLNPETGFSYASPSLVYTLKMSHRYLRNSPHFLKTMDDIHALRKLNYGISPILEDWLKIRMKETYYYAHPSLAQNKANFFKDDVPYKYDHDTIHEAVKTFARPAFEYIKKDKAEVYCSKEKFNEASDAIKLATVLEESYVLALERHQIPNDFKPNRRKSFEIALMKVCTSIASGWWRAYAWEHYHEVLSLYGDHYVDRFKTAVDKRIVRLYEKRILIDGATIVQGSVR